MNESEKLIFFRNKCYNRLRVRRRIREKSTTRRSLGWHATDRQPPERPLIRQTRKREGRPLPPIWTSVAFRPTSRTDPLGGATCFKKCSIAELFITRFLFGYDRPPPTLHTGRGEGFSLRRLRDEYKTRRLPVKNKHQSSAVL